MNNTPPQGKIDPLIHAAYDDLWLKSSQRNWELGRLGLYDGSTYTIDVPGQTGVVYVSRGADGDQGPTTAKDVVGVAAVGFQRVRMRREFGRLVIREAEYYAAGTGAPTTLASLTDVDLTGLGDGDGLQWDLASGTWIPVTISGGGGAPSPHDLSGVHHSGTLNWSLINFSGSNLSDLATRNHSSLSGVTANQHHNQVHALVGSDHTATGLTAGNVVRASGTATFAWAQLQHTDLGGVTANQHHNQVHSITGSDHTITGSAFQVVGATAANTLGLLTPSSNPGAGAAILRTASDGTLQLDTALFKVDATTHIVTFDTTLMAVSASAHTVKFDTTVLVIDAAADTITAAGAATFNSTAVFNGAVTLNSNGTFNTGVFRFNTDPQLNSDLDFIGGNRSITGSNSVTIAPTTDLTLDPGGLILLPTAQEMKTSTFSDLVTGIAGFRMWDRGSNYRQLTTGALKADEMYVRVFVADEVRIDRGEEYWSKSYGVVETDFTMPADEATVDVWFENSPGLAAANIFSTSDWLLARTIDWGTSLTIQKVWFQVVSLLTAGSVDGYRQQWRIRRKSGGTTGQTVKKGNTLLDAGQTGQGWIHLSALSQDGGPFIQIGEYTSVASDVPQFTNYTRMGNLNGIVDYSVNTWGFAAGGDLGVAPSAGFSGLTADATNGLRLFNTNLYMYQGGILRSEFTASNGLNFMQDSAAFGSPSRYIAWYSTLTPTQTGFKGGLSIYDDGTYNTLLLQSSRPVSGYTSAPVAVLGVSSGPTTELMSLWVEKDIVTIGTGTTSGSGVLFRMTRAGLFGFGIVPVSTGHFYESTTATGTSAGVTIQQNGSGDAVLQFLLTGGQRWVMGIDNSVTDNFVLSSTATLGSSNVLSIDSSTFEATLAGAMTLGDRLFISKSSSSVYDPTTAAHTGYLNVENPSSTTGASMGLAMRVSNASGAIQRGFIGFVSDASGSSPHIVFKVRTGASTYEERMRIDASTGNVNVAHTLAAAAVTATGNIVATGKLGSGGVSPASTGHFYESTTTTGAGAGVTIEQASSGDAILQMLLSGGQRWVFGIDNSDGDSLKIAPSADVGSAPVATFTTAGKIGIGTTAPSLLLDLEWSTSGANGLQLTATDSASDPIMQFYYPTSTKFWTMGMDRSQSDAFVLTATNVLADTAVFILTRTGDLGLGGTAPDGFGKLSVAASGQNPFCTTLYGSTSYGNLVRRAGGSIASPSAATSGMIMGGIGALGYTSGGWPTNASVEVQLKATENYTTTARGGKLMVYVTKNGGTAVAVAMELGDDRQAFLPGVYAHTTATAANVNVDSDGWLRQVTSSARYKTDIQPLPPSDLLDRLKPIRYKPIAGSGGGDRYYPGLIAEDVMAAGGDLFVTFDADNQPQSIMYERLIVIAISELQAMKRRLAKLEERLN